MWNSVSNIGILLIKSLVATTISTGRHKIFREIDAKSSDDIWLAQFPLVKFLAGRGIPA